MCDFMTFDNRCVGDLCLSDSECQLRRCVNRRCVQSGYYSPPASTYSSTYVAPASYSNSENYYSRNVDNNLSDAELEEYIGYAIVGVIVVAVFGCFLKRWCNVGGCR